MGNEPSYVKEAKKAATTSQALGIYEKKLQDRIKRKGSDSKEVAEVYRYMGELMREGGQHKQALEYYKKVIEYIERNRESETKDTIGQLYFNMGTSAFYIKEYEDANSYYNKAFEAYKDLDQTAAPFFPGIFDQVVGEYMNIKRYDYSIYFQQLILKWNIAKYGKFHNDLAKMHDKLGDSYILNLQYDKAIESISHALEIYISTKGDKDKEVANTYEKLGLAYQNQGFSECSIDYYRKSLDIKKEILPKTSVDLARLYNELGNSHFNKGNFEEASNYYKNAFNIFSDNLGNTEIVAETSIKLAKSFSARYLHKDAIKTSNKAKEIYKKLGNKDMEIADVDSTIATFYSSIEIFDEAISHLSNALGILTQFLDENDLKVAIVETRLGVAYIGEGIYSEAHLCFEKALRIYNQEKITSKNLSDLIDCYCGLASCFREEDRIDDALRSVERAFKSCSHLSDDDPLLSNILMLKGEILLEIASYEESINTFNLVLQKRSKFYLNKSHSSIAETYNSIGSVYLAKGLYKQAMEWHKKALELYKKYYSDENHIPIVLTYNKMGYAHLYEGQYDEALKYFIKYTDIWAKLGDSDHQNVVQGYQKIAEVYSRKGELDKALENLKKAFDILGKKAHRMNKHLAKLYANIGLIYKRANEPKEAIKYYTQSMEGYQQLFGENHKDYKQIYDFIEAMKSLEEYDFSEDREEHKQETAANLELHKHDHLENFAIKKAPLDESSLFHCLGMALEPQLYTDVEYYIGSIRKFTLMTIVENREDFDFIKDMKSSTLEEYLPNLIETKPGTSSDLIGIAKYFGAHFWIFGVESNGSPKLKQIVTGSVPSNRRIILFEIKSGEDVYYHYLEAKLKSSDKIVTVFEIDEPEVDSKCEDLLKELIKGK